MKRYTAQLVNTAKLAVKAYRQGHIAAYSARGAFFVLLSAQPFVTAAQAVAQMLVKNGFAGIAGLRLNSLEQLLLQYFGKETPPLLYKRDLPFFSLTTLFLLWSAAKGVRSIGQGINVIYCCSARQSFLREGVRGIACCLMAIVLCLAALVALGAVMPLQKYLDMLPFKKNSLVAAVVDVRLAVVFLFLCLLFALAYKFLCHKKTAFVQQLWGAALAALGWMVYSYGFSVYIRNFKNFGSYGPVGGAVVLMLWLYMCINILLCGALFNKIKAEGFKEQ